MHKRKYYKNLFADFPDVVDTKELAILLGGINDKTVRKLLNEKYIESYIIRGKFYIPKCFVINYLLSDHYKNYKCKLKNSV